MEDLILAWEDFRGVLKLYGKALSTLNAPCPPGTLRDVERDLRFELPESLAALLKLNNGQTPGSAGIFKSVSGWDVYCRNTFLDAEGIAIAYKAFVQDEDLLAQFGDQEIPFAASDREIFSVHRENGTVGLIWTEVSDPFLPPEWQLWRFDRGKNLAEFFRRQVVLYR